MVRRHILLFIFCLIASINISAQVWERVDIDIYETFADFEHVLHENNDTTYVVNFWATWCGPCVKELPYFEDLNEVYKNDKVKIVLVSLDFENHIDKKLIPFLNKREIISDVVCLIDGKANKWIDKVDPAWSGAIPITLIYNNKERLFFEKQFHSVEELTEIINPLL